MKVLDKPYTATKANRLLMVILQLGMLILELCTFASFKCYFKMRIIIFTGKIFLCLEKILDKKFPNFLSGVCVCVYIEKTKKNINFKKWKQRSMLFRTL